jgi:hypothetical protein
LFPNDSIGVFSNQTVLSDLPIGELFTANDYINSTIKNSLYPWQTQPYLFKRNFLLKNQIFFPETYIAEDVVFNCKAFLTSKKMLAFREPFYFYNSRPGTLKSAGGISRAIDCLIAINSLTYESSKSVALPSLYNKDFLSLGLNFLKLYFVIRILSSEENSEDLNVNFVDALIKRGLNPDESSRLFALVYSLVFKQNVGPNLAFDTSLNDIKSHIEENVYSSIISKVGELNNHI